MSRWRPSRSCSCIPTGTPSTSNSSARSSRGRFPMSTSRSLTRSSGRSASTNGPRPPRSTRRSRRCSRGTCGGSPSAATRPTSRSPRSCSPTAASSISAPPRTTPPGRCSPVRRAGPPGRLTSRGRPSSPTCCALTWAARRATCASSTTARCRSAAPARSRTVRSRCRCSRSTPSGPAVGQSRGVIRAARSASARAPPEPSQDPPATAVAGPSRR